MLLLSACGPITTPVAACATAAVSLELGVAAIREGKAKLMFVGGTEDFAEEVRAHSEATKPKCTQRNGSAPGLWRS